VGNNNGNNKAKMHQYLNCCVDSIDYVEVQNNKRDFNSIVIQTETGPATVDVKRSTSIALAMAIMHAETSRVDSQVTVLTPEMVFDLKFGGTNGPGLGGKIGGIKSSEKAPTPHFPEGRLNEILEAMGIKVDRRGKHESA
jgi:hypothetical protein